MLEMRGADSTIYDRHSRVLDRTHVLGEAADQFYELKAQPQLVNRFSKADASLPLA
jgi:hypothetical protein